MKEREGKVKHREREKQEPPHIKRKGKASELKGEGRCYGLERRHFGGNGEKQPKALKEGNLNPSNRLVIRDARKD